MDAKLSLCSFTRRCVLTIELLPDLPSYKFGMEITHHGRVCKWRWKQIQVHQNTFHPHRYCCRVVTHKGSVLLESGRRSIAIRSQQNWQKIICWDWLLTTNPILPTLCPSSVSKNNCAFIVRGRTVPLLTYFGHVENVTRCCFGFLEEMIYKFIPPWRPAFEGVHQRASLF